MDQLASARMQVEVIQPTSINDHKGEYYIDFMARMHKALRPKTYLEVGCNTGDSLILAECKSIGIDPSFAHLRNVSANKTVLNLYQMTSDDFFGAYSPEVVLGQKIDLAFLDGMHFWEFLLRDFINTERSCKTNSIVLMHDCIPVDAYTAERANDHAMRLKLSTRPDQWAGDVWKVNLILRKYRPDLWISCFDAPPTGLVAITNLDPTSDLLQRNYRTICEEFGPIRLANYGLTRWIDECRLESTRDYYSIQDFSSKFWL